MERLLVVHPYDIIHLHDTKSPRNHSFAGQKAGSLPLLTIVPSRERGEPVDPAFTLSVPELA
jgi:hypothetical protein